VRSSSAEYVQRYWEPDPERRIAARDAREYDEVFRELLFDAVAASMRSSGRVWSDMSGGLDSSTVTALAASLRSSGRVPEVAFAAFSRFASVTTQSDESSFQQAFLQRCPIEQRALDIDAYPSFSLDEPPSFHPSKAILYRPIWHAAADLLATDGVVAHITGRGGDNLFCGDGFPPVHLADVIQQFGWRTSGMGWSNGHASAGAVCGI
jgi:asparagine synthase (glutamine-hydrolysing)